VQFILYLINVSSIVTGGIAVISNQIIRETINDLYDIMGVQMWVCDVAGNTLAYTKEAEQIPVEVITSLLSSVADNIEVQGQHYFKVYDQKKPVYILSAGGKSDSYSVGKIAVTQLQRLVAAYKEKYDVNSFLQNLLLDNLLLVDIYNRAKQLKIDTSARRIVFVIKTWKKKDESAVELVRSLYSSRNKHFVTEVDEDSIILIKNLEKDETFEEQETTASTLVDMLNTEVMTMASVAYGTIVEDIKEISSSYKEAKMALDVGKIFYPDKMVISYKSLGIGRLIYQLPVSLCDMFLEEVFGGHMPDEADEETLNIVNGFFENNLNISETARKLYLHRNTLTYRLEKIEKLTGLNVKNFEDAMTFKIALMVASYKEVMEKS